MQKSKSYLLFILAVIVVVLNTSCQNNKQPIYQKFDNFKTINTDFKITSEAIVNGQLLAKYQCEEKINGVENSIPLSWTNVPLGTKSLAVIMYHYPKKDDKLEVNSYLLLWNIDPSISQIPYKMANNPSWAMGANKDGNTVSYTSPCSKGPGKHEYTIALFALGEDIKSLPKSSSVKVNYEQFMKAISETKLIDRTSLTFTASHE
ncbi:MAG: YbhB/YbcL family Raf kinase inhibitor-like protein [Bacteroidetes bacterium]|nr:YbhB/YbcL family Raf kinase inhibitor-like protein [Bacteroidota bacterium]